MCRRNSQMILVLFVAAIFFIPNANSWGVEKINPTQQKPITLKMATFFASEKDIRQIYTRRWGKAITEATNGAVKFRYFPAQQLVRAKEMADALKSGIIDATTFFVPAYTPEDFPFYAAVTQIPFGLPDEYEKFVAFKEEAQDILMASFAKHNVKSLWSMDTSYGQEWFFKDPFDPKDLRANFQGKRVRSPGIVGMKIMIQWLGAERVSMSPAEVYEAGQKGIIQGCTLGFSQYTAVRAYEVFPYILMGNNTFTIPGGVPCVMRLDLFESLPEDMQKAIVEVSKAFEKSFFHDYRAEINSLKEKLLKTGKVKQIIEIDPEVKAKWRKEIAPLVDKDLTRQFPERYPKLKKIMDKYQ